MKRCSNPIIAFWMILLMAAALLLFAGCDEEEDLPGVWEPDDDSGDDDDDGDDDGDDDDDDDWDPPTCDLQDIPELDLPDHESPNVVTLDDVGRMSVNGTVMFPFGFYAMGGWPDSLDEIAQSGLNNGQIYTGCCNGGTLQTQTDFINACEDAGIFAWIHGISPHDLVHTEPRPQLNEWIAARAELPGLLMWYTFDEPGLWGYDPEYVQAEHDLLQEEDPNHPTSLVMMASVPYETYIDQCNVFMVDPYPIPFMPIGLVSAQVQAAVETAEGRGENGDDKPVWAVVQAFDWQEMWGTKPPEEPWRPTTEEMRSMTYQAIAAGAQGVVYFAHYRVSASTEWEGFKLMAQEVSALSSVWLSDTIPGPNLLVSDPETTSIVYRLFDYGDRYYLLAVNNGITSTYATFDISSLGDNPCAIDVFDTEVREIDQDGVFSEQFPYMATRLYQITDEAKGGCR